MVGKIAAFVVAVLIFVAVAVAGIFAGAEAAKASDPAYRAQITRAAELENKQRELSVKEREIWIRELDRSLTEIALAVTDAATLFIRIIPILIVGAFGLYGLRYVFVNVIWLKNAAELVAEPWRYMSRGAVHAGENIPMVGQYGAAEGVARIKDAERMTPEVAEALAAGGVRSVKLGNNTTHYKPPALKGPFGGVPIPPMLGDATDEYMESFGTEGAVLSIRDLPVPAAPYAIPLGRGANSSVEADLDGRHLITVGAPGTGKTVAMQSYIESLLARHTPDTLQQVLIDPKRNGLYPFASHPCTKEFSDEQTEWPDLLDWVNAERDTRQKFLKESGIHRWNAQVAHDVQMPLLIVWVDEITEVTHDTETMERLLSVMRKGPGAGVVVCLVGHYLNAETVRRELRAMASHRVCFASGSSTDSVLMLGEGGAEKLPMPGHALCKVNNGPVTRIVTPHTTLVQPNIHGATVRPAPRVLTPQAGPSGVGHAPITLEERIIQAFIDNGGSLTRTELHAVTGNSLSEEELNDILARLAVVQTKDEPDGPGRPPTRAHALADTLRQWTNLLTRRDKDE